MSGSDYTRECPKCKSVITVRGRAMTLALTCNTCGVYFRTGDWNKTQTQFSKTGTCVLPVGSKGRFDNFLYEVMGFTVKEENKYHYQWREYLLFNPYRGYAFLSEYDGHWNFVWGIENSPQHRMHDGEFDFEGSNYHFYQRYSAQVVYAKGEFFFDVVTMTEDTVNYEYIAPPYLLALEQSNDSRLWCKGEYITQEEIAAAFSIDRKTLPAKTGIGYTQPFDYSFSDNALILMTIAVVCIAIGIQLFLNNQAAQRTVFSADFQKSDLVNQKLFVTPTFDLEGTKSLEIIMSAPLDNDWLFSEFTLVNESSGQEYNFTKDLEYYSGYEGGESWSEGSKSAEGFLSQIPAGRYHINIYPEFGTRNEYFTLTVLRDVSANSNLLVAALLLMLFPAFHFIRKRIREARRWRDSEYSPYETD